MPIRFAVLGDGAWGTAIALLLAQDPVHEVRLWSAREENGRSLQHHRENLRLLPGIAIPPSILLTRDIEQATREADLWITDIATFYLCYTLR
jgi:glycerol-3-phosphate dehydrogenase (NAD(P)+)